MSKTSGFRLSELTLGELIYSETLYALVVANGFIALKTGLITLKFYQGDIFFYF